MARTLWSHANTKNEYRALRFLHPELTRNTTDRHTTVPQTFEIQFALKRICQVREGIFLQTLI